MKTRTIHSLYIIGILIGIIVLLATYKVGDEDSTIKYISFASTISSLLLATIAIIYAYFSNFSIAKAVGKVTEVSSGLESHGKNIERFSEAIEKNLQTVPGLLEGVQKGVDSSLEGLKEVLREKSLSEDKIVNSGKEKKIEIDDDWFFGKISLSGAMLYYSLKRANEENVPINLRKIGEITGTSFDYLHGMIVMTNSLGVTNSTNKDDMFNIIFLNEKIKAGIEQCLLAREEAHSEWMQENHPDATQINRKTIIDKYFDE